MSSHSLTLLNHKYTPLPIPLPPDPLSTDGTPSLSSTSSLESSPSYDHSLIFIPNKTCSFSGIPFSWEKLPGIPKRQLSKKIQDPSLNLLPLPPSTGTPTPSRKYNPNQSFGRDPFFIAFVKCSKDNDEKKGGDFWKRSTKITSLSNRFAFVKLSVSCKSSCPVSDSIIYVRKPRKHYLSN